MQVQSALHVSLYIPLEPLGNALGVPIQKPFQTHLIGKREEHCVRMKGIVLVLLIMVLLGNTAFAEYMHIHTFGGSGIDVPLDVIALRDGGFLMVGNTRSNDGDVSDRWNTSKDYCDALAIVIDSSHNIRFRILIGTSDSANEQFIKAIQLPDGGFALLYEYSDEETHKYELLRYNDSGTFIETIPIPKGTTAILGLDDGFLAAGGFSEYYDPNQQEGPWLARFSFDGTQRWMLPYDELIPWTLHDAKQSGNRLVCAGIWREAYADYSGSILCFDLENREVLWTYNTEAEGFARLDRLTVLGDGSVVAIGWKSGVDEQDRGLAVRLDKDGQLIWKKTFPRFDSSWFTDLLEISEGILVSGTQMYEEEGKLYTAGMILTLNERGNVEKEYERDMLLNMAGGMLVRGTDGLPYYFCCGGAESDAEDFFMWSLTSPTADPMSDFDGMGEYE